MRYDYLIVGAGLTGAVLARELTDAGKRCLVLERRGHIGGNIYTQSVDGIEVHRYGAHILHTNSDAVWRYLCRFASMNRFINSPLASYRGKLYNLPFNMNTFYQMWGVTTPAQARAEIERQRAPHMTGAPRNLEEQALQLVGRDVYERLIKGYTQKQWGRPCDELPPEIIRRIPVRFTFDNNYFDAAHQGVPTQGYTALVQALLAGAQVETGVDFLRHRERYESAAPVTLYTGCIDAYYDHRFGALEYRSVRFETERLETDDYQGNAVVNHTDAETPYTRVIEHKHFTFGKQPHTIISREYSAEWTPADEPYYPIGNARNLALYERYRALAQSDPRTIFCGRLAQYRYLDMDAAVENALATARRLTGAPAPAPAEGGREP